jgi:hypothetical protein
MAPDSTDRHALDWLRCSVVCILCLAGCGDGGGGASEVEPTCRPACSPTAHEVCDDDTESPSCTCAPGYEGDPCTWAGVVEHPGFEDQEAWATSRGATVLPHEGAPTDDGIAFFI